MVVWVVWVEGSGLEGEEGGPGRLGREQVQLSSQNLHAYYLCQVEEVGEVLWKTFHYQAGPLFQLAQVRAEVAVVVC